MSNDVIFFTQVGSAIAFFLTLFVLYRLLVAQKDSVIELLKERIADREAKISKLESEGPDALVAALSARVDSTMMEIARLREDGDKHLAEIAGKERKLNELRLKLLTLSESILDSDLMCRKCGAPLIRKEFYPIFGVVNGREVEAEGEYIEYDCGLALKDGREVSPCKSAPTST